jgi:hypothetical protein
MINISYCDRNTMMRISGYTRMCDGGNSDGCSHKINVRE